MSKEKSPTMGKPAEGAKRYFKHSSESRLGEGWAWLEFDAEGWPSRQVERYGDRWFCSLLDYHPDVGPCLCDQPLDQLELHPEEEITREEFEVAWATATAQLGKT